MSGAAALKKRSSRADARPEMPHRRWVYGTRVAAAAGLAVFAAYTLFVPASDRFFTLFNTWVYDGLMVLACVIAGSHAYLVRRERAAWIVITAALASWTFGEIWWAVQHVAAMGPKSVKTMPQKPRNIFRRSSASMNPLNRSFQSPFSSLMSAPAMD